MQLVQNIEKLSFFLKNTTMKIFMLIVLSKK